MDHLDISRRGSNRGSFRGMHEKFLGSTGVAFRERHRHQYQYPNSHFHLDSNPDSDPNANSNQYSHFDQHSDNDADEYGDWDSIPDGHTDFHFNSYPITNIYIKLCGDVNSYLFTYDYFDIHHHKQPYTNLD